MDSLSNSTGSAAHDGPVGDLSIGDLAERTGVPPTTLRAWEQRHGFPSPGRLTGGQRRYRLTDVEDVLEVVRRRSAGARLDSAIAEVVQIGTRVRTPVPSVWARVRARHPGLPVARVRKPTLVALSRALEDELAARGRLGHLFGGFQQRRHLLPSWSRWQDLAGLADSAYVFAHCGGRMPSGPGPHVIDLAQDAPLTREWVVACDGGALSLLMASWESPGQGGVEQHDRAFELILSLDPAVVRDASRVCAEAAAVAGAPGAATTLAELDRPAATSYDVLGAGAVLVRALGYLDRAR